MFFGERESGQDVRTSNATAVQAVANIVKSSLGPVGLDKVRVIYLFIFKVVFWKEKVNGDRFFFLFFLFFCFERDRLCARAY